MSFPIIPRNMKPNFAGNNPDNTVAINHRMSSRKTDSMSIEKDQQKRPTDLSGLGRNPDYKERRNTLNDVILCGVCSDVFSSADECNQHIMIVSNKIKTH